MTSESFEQMQFRLQHELVIKHIDKYPLVSERTFAKKVRYEGDDYHDFVERLISEEKVFKVKIGQQTLLPLFLIDTDKCCIYPVVADVLAYISFLPGKAMYSWFCTDNPLLRCSPADALANSHLHDAVIGAAESRRLAELL